MNKRNRLRSYRPKAQFGQDGAIMAAATLSAAGITSAATAASAAIQSKATEKAAQEQAKAMEEQNENDIRLQENNADFTRQENERNRDLQREIQMNLQLLTGQQNASQIRDTAKIQVKNGGSMKRKLRNANAITNDYSLRGINGNLPFVVTDGGNVIPIGVTKEGYDMYEIAGNDHEHYHKARGGKNKTGVGIKFISGETIEGEGNQNTNQGEYMIVTPNDAKFISKHTIKGYNPVEAINAGEDPMYAFAIQEQLKDIYGINDDGTKAKCGGKTSSKSPVKRSKHPYGGINTLPVSPDLSLDFLAPVATGIVAGTRSLKCGGRVKAKCGCRNKKFVGGTDFNISPLPAFPSIQPVEYHSLLNSPTNTNSNSSFMNQNIKGANINALSNLGAGIINTAGNIAAGVIGSQGYQRAGNILANAAKNLKVIDPNIIKRSDFASTPAMAAIQIPVINTGSQRAEIERSSSKAIENIRRGTLSSAAAQNRINSINSSRSDILNKVESEADRLKQGILRGNAQRITQVSSDNANREIQANQAYANARMNLEQQRVEGLNDRIRLGAQAIADGMSGRISTLANMSSRIGQNLSNAANAIGSGYNNAYMTNAKYMTDITNAALGASDEAALNLILGNGNMPEYSNIARGLYNRYKNGNSEQQKIAEQINNIYKFV